MTPGQPAYTPKILLYQHQAAAVRYCLEHDGVALLHMEMGTGKTIVALTVAGALWARGLIDDVWVLCPKAALGVWEHDAVLSLNLPYVLTLPAHRRAPPAPDLRRVALRVWVVNYDLAWRRADDILAAAGPRTLVIADEVQKIKTASTRRGRFMAALSQRVPYRLGLSGTPAPKGPLDYHGVFKFLVPGLFPSAFYRMREEYAVTHRVYKNMIFSYRNLDDLKAKVARHTFTARKADCLDLPPKTRQLLDVELSSEERRVYEELAEEFVAAVHDAQREGKVLADHVLSRLLRLSQVTGGTVSDGTCNYELGSSKLDALAELLEPLRDQGERVIVYCRFRIEVERIVILAAGLGLAVGIITGDMTPAEREESIRLFEDTNPSVLVLTLGAGSEAINLSCAAYTIFYSLDFDLSHVEQADARNDREGQTRPMTTYFLLASDSVDWYMYRAVAEKRRLQDWIGGFVDELRRPG